MVNVPEQYVWAQLTGPTRPNLTITGSLFIDGDPIVTNQGGLLLEISGAGDLGSEILISQNQPGDKTVVKNPTAKNWGPGYVLLRFGGSTKRAVAGQGPGTYGRVEYDLQISGMAPCAPPPEGSTVTCNPTVPQAAQCDKEAGRPISTRSGAFFESYTDLSVGGLGQPLEVKRTYNSLLRTTDSEFGFGWSSSLAPRLRVDWPTTGDATFRWSSGSEVKYSYTNTSGSVRRYTAPPWVTGKLTATGSNSSRVFTLVLPNGFVWKFNSTGQPLESADRNGYKLVYSYVSSKLSTVTQLPTNRMLSVTWTTTTPPRVDTVTDPAGRVVDYDYDSSGNLIQAATKEPNGGPLVTTGTWKWGYGTGSEPAQHRVLTVRDPRQVAAGAGGLDMVNEYTGERVTTQTMPNNVRYLFGYAGATDALTTTVTLQEKVGSTWTDRQKRQDIHVAGRRVRTIEGVGSAQPMTYDFSYDPTTGGVTRTSLILSGSSVTMAQSEYDAKGRVTKVTDRAGRFTTMSYNSFGQVTQSVDNKGVPSRFAYSAEGDLHEVESDNVATGQTREVRYNLSPTVPGRVDSMVDPMGKTWTYGYDPNGYLSSVQDPLGNVTSSTFDSIGRPLTVTSPKGNATGTPGDFTTTYSRNVAARSVTMTDAEGHVTSSVYDQNGNLDAYTDANNNTVDYQYDAANRQIAVVRPVSAGVITTEQTAWTADDQVALQTDNAGALTRYTYDPFGRLASAVDPLLRTTMFGYDNQGRLIQRQDSGGNCAASPKVGCVTYGYNTNSELATTDFSDPATADITAVTYDTLGRMTGLTKGGQTSGWGYDDLGNLTGSAEGFELVSGQLAPGQTVTIPIGGGTSGIPASGVSAVAVELGVANGTNIGFLTAYSGDPGPVPGTSNLNYGVNQVITNAAVVKVGANSAIKITNSGPGAVDVIIDAQGWYSAQGGQAGGTFTPLNPARITTPTVVVPASGTIDVTVAGAGGIPATGVGSVTTNLTVVEPTALGTLRAYAPDQPAPTTTNVIFGPGTILASMSIVKVGANGKIRLENTSGAPLTVIVDAFGWTSVAAQNGQSDFVTVNPTRITNQSVPAGASVDIPVAGQNGVASTATAVSLNLTAADGTGSGFLQAWATGQPAPNASVLNYTTYPVANAAIVKVGAGGKITVKNNSATATVIVDINGYWQITNEHNYTYFPSGLRASKTGPSGTTTFTWSSEGNSMLLASKDPAGGITRYVYGPGGRILEQINPDTTVVLFHHDQLGSIRAATNATGTTLATWAFDPYGNTTATTGNPAITPFGYAGEYTDPETGFQYLRNRYYDPATASFLTRDPITPATRSPYGYTDGSPLNGRDPLGLYWGEEWVNAVVSYQTNGVFSCVDVLDANCNSVKEQYPAQSQGVADAAGGYLNGLSFGNAEHVIGDRVNWDSGITTAGDWAGWGSSLVWALAYPRAYGAADGFSAFGNLAYGCRSSDYGSCLPGQTGSLASLGFGSWLAFGPAGTGSSVLAWALANPWLREAGSFSLPPAGASEC